MTGFSPVQRIGRRRGFTLVDLLVTVSILAIVAAIAAPALSPNDAARIRGGARLLASDIEYAQSLSLSSPEDQAMLNFASDGSGYWIAMESDPDTPVTMPSSGEPYRVVFGEGRGALLFDVAIDLEGVPFGRLPFDHYARPDTGEDAVIRFFNVEEGLIVRVTGATGLVRIEPDTGPFDNGGEIVLEPTEGFEPMALP